MKENKLGRHIEHNVGQKKCACEHGMGGSRHGMAVATEPPVEAGTGLATGPHAQLAQLARQGWQRCSDTVCAGAWRASCKSKAAVWVEALLEAKGGRLVGVLRAEHLQERRGRRARDER